MLTRAGGIFCPQHCCWRLPSRALWNFHLSGKLVCGVLARLLMLRLFVIYYDQQHHAILPKSRLAEWLMRVWHPLAQPQQHLAQFAQLSSQTQFQTAQRPHRLAFPS